MPAADFGTVVYRALGRKTISLFHRPAGPQGRRFPAVLFLHGFPGAEKNIDVQRALLERGVASFAPHFHGAWGSAGVYRFSSLVDQARAALRYLARRPWADPRRLAVFGFSMGGWTAIHLAARERSLKAVAAVAPVGGGEMAGFAARDFIRRARRILQAPASPALYRDFVRSLKAGDPARSAASLKSPLLLIHGTRDSVVPYAVSRRILAAAGRRARLITAAGAQHSFLDRRGWLTRAAADWLAKNLKK